MYNCLLCLEQMSVYLFVVPGANVCVSNCLLCLEQMSVYMFVVPGANVCV